MCIFLRIHRRWRRDAWQRVEEAAAWNMSGESAQRQAPPHPLTPMEAQRSFGFEAVSWGQEW